MYLNISLKINIFRVENRPKFLNGKKKPNKIEIEKANKRKKELTTEHPKIKPIKMG